MDRFYAAPVAELLEFDLPLNRLFIFADVVITPLADIATQRDQLVSSFNFSHEDYPIIFSRKMQ
jgi:hypothetical protein